MSSLKKIFSVKLIVIFLCFHAHIKAQDLSLFPQFEDTLKKTAFEMLYGKRDDIRYEANENFTKILSEALNTDKSFEYPFDSLKSISRLVSPDKTFRIFNWGIPLSDGTYRYYGIIQSYNKKEDRYCIYQLSNKSDKMESPETQQKLTYDNWYGSLYYKLIIKKGNKKHYILLGWDGSNTMSSKKIIEVLTFTPQGEPLFGYSVFNYLKYKNYSRIIFEYSAKATMSLKYEKQYYKKHIKKYMIVFDHLIPLNSSMEGQHQFYVPETNIFDAFIFKNKKWTYYTDIDARNPKNKTKKKAVKYNLTP